MCKRCRIEMRQYFPACEFEPPDQKPVYTTTTLSIEEMDAAVEYEAGTHKSLSAA
ncbi:MAG: hypothetical protein GY862_09765 [Gammaproteobacteria bacterium]|nr:hypothetical protein [Gammaproteobacteria bacterium]